MGGVRGVLLNSSVLLPANDYVNGDTVFLPSADFLLRKLRYSNIPTGISHERGLSSPKEHLHQELATAYLCTIFCLSPEDDISSKVARIWEGKGGKFIHVVSCCRDDLCQKENRSDWLKVIVGSTDRKPPNDANSAVAIGMSSVSIQKLGELPLLICNMNREVFVVVPFSYGMGKDALTVGYVMKASREEDFAKRVDAVLHKATDEILAVDMGSHPEFSDRVTFTRNLQELQRYIKCQTNICVIDPFNNIFPTLDQLKIQQILIGLETLNMEGRCKIKAPHFVQVDSFDDPNLEQRLAEAKLSLPSIVKPQVACGVSDAHSMAIVFKVDHYKDLNVPLPAMVQEYVNHSSLLYKFYALGGKIFHAVKKSTPNADTLMHWFADDGLKPLHFDSIKSVPVAKEQLNADGNKIDFELVRSAVDWLRRTLYLTVFGFDVVQEGSGDHVIVDVNYLPSFKEVPDAIAIPAFWDALKEKIVSTKSKQAGETS